MKNNSARQMDAVSAAFFPQIYLMRTKLELGIEVGKMCHGAICIQQQRAQRDTLPQTV